MGAWSMDARWINGRIPSYQATAKFGSPMYALTGENYLLGEFRGEEYSGFSPLTTKRFQDWCRQQYRGSLDALNAEWGSRLESWDQVRGILLSDAVEKKQLPRWVDFRYFMRSQVWSGFFLDWSDMMRRFVPEIRTGKLGHDHHDFSRYRDNMGQCKLYIGQVQNTEWREALVPELYQSFTGDRSFLMASQSMIRWSYDMATPIDRLRWPWKTLFLGLRGFDWEQAGATPRTLGGHCCLTPDFSEPLPYFQELSREVLFLQRGLGKLTIACKPYRSQVAMLWAPYNHFISRLFPFQENGFSGTWLYNISVTGGAPSDCLALLNSLRIRPTIVAPEDLAGDGLAKRGFRALLLPYNRGMSAAEAAAIRRFVEEGGLVIADNRPAVCSEHGRELGRPRLVDLFPRPERKSVVRFGKGWAAYLPGEINGYTGRFEKCDYTGAESVAALLAECAGQHPPVELIDGHGRPRRDTLMPLFLRGSTKLLGLLRASTSAGREPEETTLQLPEPCHLWDVRARAYCGYAREFSIRLGLEPHYYALLPSQPLGLALTPDARKVRQGEDAVLQGRVDFGAARPADSASIAQAVHVRVYGPSGEELEHFRQNLVFDGPRFQVVLPVSLSEPPGRYRLEAEHVLTGMKAQTWFDVAGN
jgi:hypothetical protein